MPADDPHAYVRKKLLDYGYASLTHDEKAEWQASVYGFRRVLLGVAAGERTSPTDPAGEWYDETRVRHAERYYRAAFKSGRAA